MIPPVEVPDEVHVSMALLLKHLLQRKIGEDGKIDEDLIVTYQMVLAPTFPVSFYVYIGLLEDRPGNETMDACDEHRTYKLTGKAMSLFLMDEI